MKAILILLFLVILSDAASPQNDYVSAVHPVYTFLKSMSVRGIISEYSDAVLPLSRKEITNHLFTLNKNSEHLSSTEIQLVSKYLSRFDYSDFNIVTEDIRYLFRSKEKKFYYYIDSLTSFSVSPVFETSLMYSTSTRKSSSFFNFGGYSYGSYSDWFGFSVSATNAYVTGDRETAAFDERVRRSFTFNQTAINFFDETRGHFGLHSGIFHLQFGRERILWGVGYNDRLILSDNPPLFDFLRFNISYKILNYDFLHGWLVQNTQIKNVDLLPDVEIKPSKYIAANRLGINLSNNLNLGVSQVMIYSNRPLEAAYLNPFLLWESAQRSLHDLDNSFLILDAEVKAAKGLAVSGTYLFDDINFNLIEDWNNISNRSGWQLSTFITYPVVLKDMILKLEYTQIRPYTFSHLGTGTDALTYTNSGYMLSYPYQPNSALLSFLLGYNFSEDISLNIKYSFLKHGDNKRDSSGILQNYGGNIFEFPRDSDPGKTYLFEGILTNEHVLSFTFSRELLRNYLLEFNSDFIFSKTEGVSVSRSIHRVTLNLFIL
jgi:hypothetical protein